MYSSTSRARPSTTLLITRPKGDAMNIHEYQAKGLMAKFGVAVPRGPSPIRQPRRSRREAARPWGKDLGGEGADPCRGRGKAGGVKIACSEAEVAAAASELLGKKLVTHQTGPEGNDVKRV